MQRLSIYLTRPYLGHYIADRAESEQERMMHSTDRRRRIKSQNSTRRSACRCVAETHRYLGRPELVQDIADSISEKRNP